MKPATALVAGAGGAGGVAICRALQGDGYRVVGAGRSYAALADELGDATHDLVQVQLGSHESVCASLGPIQNVEVLVYNAGQIDLAPLADTTPEMFLSSWQTNALGAFLCARLIAPQMLERGQGTMLFMGATASLRGGARTHAFAAGKHALRGLAESLAKELGPKGVHVAHVVIDGKVWGERTRQRFPGVPESECLAPDGVARAVSLLVRQPRSAWTFELDLRPQTAR